MGESYEFTSGNFFVLRTPLLPFGDFSALSEGLESPEAFSESKPLDSAISKDRAEIRGRLNRIFKRPEVREGIWLASRDLYESLQAWEVNPESERGRRTERSLYRYLARMCGRPVPFGLFAGYAIGTFRGKTDFVIGGKETLKRHTQIDPGFLFALVKGLTLRADLKDTLVFRPNFTLYSVGGQLNYVRVSLNQGERYHELAAVEETPEIEFVLERSQSGATFFDLAQGLREVDPDLPETEVSAFLEGIIQRQILVPEILPSMTGKKVLLDLIDRLKPCEKIKELVNLLESTVRELGRIDVLGVGLEPQEYDLLQAMVSKISGNGSETSKISYPFQVDLLKSSVEVVLDHSVALEILKGVEAFRRLGCIAISYEKELERFREAFTKCYEGAEVPLVEVLDDQMGVGYGPLESPEQELAPDGEGVFSGESPVLSSVKEFLAGKLHEALFSNSREIMLKQKDLDALPFQPPAPLPVSFSVTGTLLAPGAEAVGRGEYRFFLKKLSGPPGVYPFGRFCQFDGELRRYVQEYLREEEKRFSSAILAEVVYLPPGRLANFAYRPVFREFEIPYVGRSGAPIHRQIPVSDLLVSVRGGRIILRSSRLQREIIPRHTAPLFIPLQAKSAYLPIYQFLTALQNQCYGFFRPLWRRLGAGAPYLPRVGFGRLIFSPGAWRLGSQDLQSLRTAEDSQGFATMRKLRAKLQVPRFVSVGTGDEQIPIDLDNPLGVDVFLHLARKEKKEFMFEEMLPGPSEMFAKDDTRVYVHEVVIPYITVNPPGPENSSKIVFKESQIPRVFHPGSEWLYMKFFCHPLSADRILAEAVSRIREETIPTRLADRWFFIRYGDPAWHIRLRFHGDPVKLQAEVFSIIRRHIKPFLEKKWIRNIQLDTYVREVERYGGDEGFDLAEQVFQIDSEAVVDLMELCWQEGDFSGMRWRLTLCGIDRLLGDIGLDLPARRAFMKAKLSRYANQIGDTRISAFYKKRVSEKFRKERKNIEEILNLKSDPESVQGCAVGIFERRSEQLRPLFEKLGKLFGNGNLCESCPSLAATYVHMYVNRMMRRIAPTEEMAFYAFLGQFYESRVAHR